MLSTISAQNIRQVLFLNSKLLSMNVNNVDDEWKEMKSAFHSKVYDWL